MRQLTTIKQVILGCLLTIGTIGLGISPTGCSTTHTLTKDQIPDPTPGDLRVGIVTRDSLGHATRYIVDQSRALRASHGAGSNLSTFPGQMRRLSQSQIDEIWSRCKDLLSASIDDPAFGTRSGEDSRTKFHAGQPMVLIDPPDPSLMIDRSPLTGSIIEIHMIGTDRVFVFDEYETQAGPTKQLIDLVTTLSWSQSVDQQKDHP